MKMRFLISCLAPVSVAVLLAATATAGPILPFFFTTGSPDGKIATLSRPAGAGLETETADDFITTLQTTITGATITGLIPAGVPLSSINQVEIELYHVFPVDSTNPPSGNVPTRVNSPGDHEFAAFDSTAADISFTASLLNSSFAVANTVVNGINKSPGQFTGGEGPASGQEVLLNITFNKPLVLAPDHYFFRPEVGLSSGNFLWLSAPRPVFTGDLQSWIRNAGLSPDWLRIGTDITGQGPFNAAFSLTGTQSVPEPSTLLILGTGLAMLASWRRR